MAPGIARGDVRLYKFPAPDKQFPVLVLTRESAIKFLSKVTVVDNAWRSVGGESEVILTEEEGMERRRAMNIHNAITVLQVRLGKRVGHLSRARMNDVCSALRFSLGCD